ncbi:MAG TPA: hypothetical protein PK201_15925, partial [Accumulibacter sp.]|nr:hypothetical protein [Accumulibacter sp.]
MYGRASARMAASLAGVNKRPLMAGVLVMTGGFYAAAVEKQRRPVISAEPRPGTATRRAANKSAGDTSASQERDDDF